MKILIRDIITGYLHTEYPPQCGDSIQFKLIPEKKISHIHWHFSNGESSTQKSPVIMFHAPNSAIPAYGNVKVDVDVKYGKKTKYLTQKFCIIPSVRCEIFFEQLPEISETTTSVELNAEIQCEAPSAGYNLDTNSKGEEFETFCKPLKFKHVFCADHPNSAPVVVERSAGTVMNTYGVYRIVSQCGVKNTVKKFKRYPPLEKIVDFRPDSEITSPSVSVNVPALFSLDHISPHLLPTGSIIEWVVDGVSVSSGTSLNYTHTFTDTSQHTVGVWISVPGCRQIYNVVFVNPT